MPSVSNVAVPVHPRVCGELRTAPPPPRCASRFIPACAGNSADLARLVIRQAGSSPRVRGTRRWPNRQRTRVAVHPRVCGELVVRDSMNLLVDGSSPRVRGTRVSCDRVMFPARFIPACAGNSHCLGSGSSGSAGSSPRVRGTPADRSVHRAPPRFIPACAGNSRPCLAIVFALLVHPRVCGELPCLWRCGSSRGGSSPRVRGTPPRTPPPAPPSRFIPACAGNSGEDSARGVSTGGSSPRVRGTHGNPLKSVAEIRFIPACAGNSLGRSR